MPSVAASFVAGRRRVPIQEAPRGGTTGSQSTGEAPSRERRSSESMQGLVDMGAVAAARAKMDTAPWYVLRPDGKLVTRWDALTSLALVFTAIVTPFEVAFLPEAESPREWLWLANRLIDLIFLMDMAMQFVMMVCSTQTADHSLCCTRAPLIGTVRDQQ